MQCMFQQDYYLFQTLSYYRKMLSIKGNMAGVTALHLSQIGQMALDHSPLTWASNQHQMLFPWETPITQFSKPCSYIKSKITICHKLLIKVPSSFWEKWMIASFWPNVLIYSLIHLKVRHLKYNSYCLLLSHIIYLYIHALWFFSNSVLSLIRI